MRKKLFLIVTPSFEPKHGKFMAYNHNKSIIIVDTQNWAVKKTLTDEQVFITFIFKSHQFFFHN